jgi:4-amino-4-deoxy-L-arabinose transferase-like glycosyltransferase
VVIGVVATVLNAWGLSSVGWGNAYYAAAVRSMSQNWHTFLYNGLDSSGFVSVDKPPLSLWVQTIFVKLFGYSPIRVLLPQVIAGTLAVVVLYLAVRSAWGRSAGLIAAAGLAVTPINVMVNHSNNTDSILVFVMVCGAALAIRAARDGSLRWLVAAAAVAGSAMTAKMLAGVPVLPGVLVAYLWCAPRAWRTRLWHTAVGAVVMAVAGLWWFTLVDLTPKTSRPYVGSSPTNSAFQLAFERNGVNQVDGQNGGFGGPGGPGGLPGGQRGPGAPGAFPGGAPPAGALPGGGGVPGGGPVGGGRAGGGDALGINGRGFSGGVPGWLRLLNADLGTQAGWLLPLAAFGSLAALWACGLRGSPRLAAIVVFGGWAASAGTIFSVTKGIVHPYYVANLGPPIAALAAIGLVVLVRDVAGRRARSVLLVVALIAGAVAQWTLVNRVDWRAWHPTYRVVMVGMLGFAIAMACFAAARSSLRLARAAGTIAVAGSLVLPLAWSFTSARAAGTGVLPYASPTVGSSSGVSGPLRPNGGFTFPAADQTSLVGYLRSKRTTEKWLVAVQSAAQAESIIIDHGEPVMAMGGFSGSDPILTTDSLTALIRKGAVRFFLMPTSGGLPGGLPGGFGGGPGGGRSGPANALVTASCTMVPSGDWGSGTVPPTAGQQAFPGGPSSASFDLYDCAKLAGS